jgi:hypothetical protein
MSTTTYTVEKITRQVSGRRMVFGRWTDEGNTVTEGWRLVRDGRPIAMYRTKRDALAGKARREAAEQ